MTTRYIFASEIRQALDRGDKELTLPAGSRLSPQAVDLVREHDLRVTFEEGPAQGPSSTWPGGGRNQAQAPGQGQGRRQAAPEAQEPASDGNEDPAGDNEPVSDDQVEAIVQRVLARLAEARGEEPPAPAPAPAAATAAPGEAPDDDLIICRCEEITKGQIRQAIRDGMATLNGVKRVTRAGMGLCQGQTCARLVSGILAQELGLAPGEVEPTTARAPNRPVPMHVFARA